jgi:3-dehydroquinate dehydratase I
MICVSIAKQSAGSCLEALEGLTFAEIRMEGMNIAMKDIQQIFSQPMKLIATCRSGRLTDETRKSFLLDAIQTGASYVDIEIESKSTYKMEVIEAARRKGCQVIISFHNYEKTPGLERLRAIISQCFAEGADVAKIACRVRSERDNARLLGLYSWKQVGKKLLVVGMGDKGKITRIMAPFLGSPFSYAALSEGQETADGQITKEKLETVMRDISDA